MQMTARSLVGWLTSPDNRRGIRILSDEGTWTFYSYAELACMSFAVADRLAADNVRAGDRVVVALESGAEFAAGLFGTLAIGATPIPLALPARFQDPAVYARQAEGVLRAGAPASLVSTAVVADRLRACHSADLLPALTTISLDELRAAKPARSAVTQPAHALVQFTSGSSGSPKGVRISSSALEANIGCIRQWLEMTPDDPTATWLPLHHDMGLVGCFLTPIVNGSDIWVMRPDQFVRSPLTWLACFGTGPARLTAAPVFGLAHALRRVTDDQLVGFDFSEWRTLILGAERLDPDVLDRFHHLLAGHGFSRRAFLPAYGLAEATLAVTGVALRREPRTVLIDRQSLQPGEQVDVRPDPTGANTLALVGCGTALGRSEIRIVGADGEPLADGLLGEILVTGPSVADGYVGTTGGRALTEISDGTIRTGDAGVLIDGELFVIGRFGDSIKVRARTVFADDLEALVVDEVAALRDARPIVLLGALEGRDTIVLVAKHKPGPWLREAAAVLRRDTAGMPVLICVDTKGVTQRTTSGKPRRRPLWNALARGEIEAVAVFDDLVEPEPTEPGPTVRVAMARSWTA